MKISLIIPVYNESGMLIKLLDQLSEVCQQGHEIIVVDAGQAASMEVEQLPENICYIGAKKGRAYQMNQGANVASGDILWFLHADTLLPEPVERYITELEDIAQPGWGWFRLRLSGKQAVFRIIERMISYRSIVSRIVTGDQGIFVQRQLFEQVGGFAALPIMEDVDLSRRLKVFKRPAISALVIQTSSRKWEEQGVMKTILLMWRVRFLYFIGVPPSRLVNQYYQDYDKA